MGTIVAIETDDGVAIAGDRRVTRGGLVTGDSTTRVVEIGEVGAAAVGEEGAVDSFRHRLAVELERVEIERGRELTVGVVGRITARVAEDADVEAVVAARDDEGVARIRQVGADGSVLADPVAALGSGRQLAVGQLEAVDLENTARSADQLVCDVLRAVAERDPATGDEIDRWSLSNESTGG